MNCGYDVQLQMKEKKKAEPRIVKRQALIQDSALKKVSARE
jgi:hypothetical protein